VAEIADLPDLLRGITEADLTDPPAVAAAGPLPDTLLPALVREVRRSRRRTGLLAAGGVLAAACIAAVLAIALTTATPASRTGTPPAGVAMHALVATPVRARVALTAEQWGTKITLHCRYAENDGPGLDYEMLVRARDGEAYKLGGWRITGGEAITYIAGAPLQPKDISAVVVQTTSGLPILRLAT
jgi:hypothetical protein